MIKVVWKFVVHLGDGFMYAPQGAKPLYAAMQGDSAVVYVLCDPDAPREQRRVLVVATGPPFDPTGLDPVGLLQIAGGLMFHVFVAP